MRLNSLTFALAAALAIPAAACGGDDGDLSAGGFITRFGDTFCGKAFECMSTFPTNLGVTFDQVFGADINACKAKLITSAQIQASVDAGRVTFSAALASTCISKVDAYACPDWWTAITGNSLPVECDTAAVGTVATGGACTIDLDCVSADCATDNTCAQ